MLSKKEKRIKDNFYGAINLCGKKDVRLYTQIPEESFDDEFVVYKDTWENNPCPTISVFFSQPDDKDFMSKLERAIEKFYEHDNKKNKGGEK